MSSILPLLAVPACGAKPGMVAAGTVAAALPSVAPDDLPQSHELVVQPYASDCPANFCGSNSPMINTFPYNGLNSGGQANSDGVRLSGFARKDSECDQNGKDDLYLDIELTDDGYQFVARDKDHPRCWNTELVGATFTVAWRTKQGNYEHRVLRISQMGRTHVEDHPGLANTETRSNTRTVYLITPEDQSANSLCTSRPPGMTAKPMPVLNKGMIRGDLVDIEGEGLPSYAVIIPGAVYEPNGTLIEKSVQPSSDGHVWFNIACATDGLAQTELSGLETTPIKDLKTAKQRLPALHMFTAQYCSGISATLRGTPIKWVKDDDHSTTLGAEGPIEARWDEDGATCLRHSRLWIPNKTISLPPQLIGHGPFTGQVAPMTEEQFLLSISKMCAEANHKPPIPICDDEPNLPGVLTSYTLNHNAH